MPGYRGRAQIDGQGAQRTGSQAFKTRGDYAACGKCREYIKHFQEKEQVMLTL